MEVLQVDTVIEPVETMTVKDTAKLIGKSQPYVRVGLITGRLPFGSAVKQEGGQSWDFNIIKSKVLDYVGLRGIDGMALGSVSKLITSKYVAYKIPASVLKQELMEDCICQCCKKSCEKIWLVANNEQLYCDHCLQAYEQSLEGLTCDWNAIKHKVGRYDKIFRT